MPGGRPSKYNPELVERILEGVREGQSIRTICKADGMPNPDTIYAWLKDKSGFSDQYARAHEERADRMSEEILEIADETAYDTTVKTNKKGDEFEAQDSEWINRSRLRVDTRKWLMARLAPKKYGDKVSQEVSGADGGPLSVTIHWGKKPPEENES